MAKRKRISHGWSKPKQKQQAQQAQPARLLSPARAVPAKPSDSFLTIKYANHKQDKDALIKFEEVMADPLSGPFEGPAARGPPFITKGLRHQQAAPRPSPKSPLYGALSPVIPMSYLPQAARNQRSASRTLRLKKPLPSDKKLSMSSSTSIQPSTRFQITRLQSPLMTASLPTRILCKICRSLKKDRSLS